MGVVMGEVRSMHRGVVGNAILPQICENIRMILVGARVWRNI